MVAFGVVILLSCWSLCFCQALHVCIVCCLFNFCCRVCPCVLLGVVCCCKGLSLCRVNVCCLQGLAGATGGALGRALSGHCPVARVVLFFVVVLCCLCQIVCYIYRSYFVSHWADQLQQQRSRSRTESGSEASSQCHTGKEMSQRDNP